MDGPRPRRIFPVLSLTLGTLPLAEVVTDRRRDDCPRRDRRRVSKFRTTSILFIVDLPPVWRPFDVDRETTRQKHVKPSVDGNPAVHRRSFSSPATPEIVPRCRKFAVRINVKMLAQNLEALFRRAHADQFAGTRPTTPSLALYSLLTTRGTLEQRLEGALRMHFPHNLCPRYTSRGTESR